MTAPSLISVVIPAFNEEENVPLLVDEIRQILPDEKLEILIVDDGSSDGTLDALRRLSQKYDFVRYISFSRNFGHQNALKAGFDAAKGACVVTMDADMQHPPQLLPQLLERWRSGVDVVHTTRQEEEGQSFFKKASSRTFYGLMRRLAQVSIPAGAADFRLMDRKVVDVCKDLHEDTFFWRAMIPWMGFKQEYIPYVPAQRRHGTTKYTLRKMLRLAVIGITSFSLVPLRFVAGLGFVTLVLSLCYLIYTLYAALAGLSAVGWASLMAVILALGGIQLLSLGTVGEYIGKIHMAVKRRPTYLVKETSEDRIQS